MNVTIEELRDMLSWYVLKVVFEKADGTLREMEATTNPLYLPEDEHYVKSDKPASPTHLTVRDIKLGAWRSFKFDSVKEFTLTDRTVLNVERPAPTPVPAL